MNNNVKHAIHVAIVLVVLWLGSLLFPQLYHFSNVGIVFLVTAAYMALYFAFNTVTAQLIVKTGFWPETTLGFCLFMAIDFIPGAIALYLMAILPIGFWAVTPWLVAIVLSVICELAYMIGAIIQER